MYTKYSISDSDKTQREKQISQGIGNLDMLRGCAGDKVGLEQRLEGNVGARHAGVWGKVSDRWMSKGRALRGAVPVRSRITK